MTSHPRGIALPVIIIIVAVVFAGAIGGVLYVFKDKPADTTTNTVVNTNVGTTTNTVVNTNTVANTNTATNTNSSTIPTDWKTYTNTKYGFSFKYPKEWTLAESTTPYGEKKYDYIRITKSVIPSNPTDSNIAVGFSVTIFPRASTESAVQAYLRAAPTDLSKTTQSPVSVGGIEGTLVKGVPAFISYNAAFIARGSYAFELSQGTGGLDDATYQQILSSFEFTASPTAEWKTYTSEEFGYSLKYPKTWTVKETNARNEVTDTMCRFITITNPETKHELHVGVRESGQTSPDIWCRTGIGAGDFTAGETVTIAGSSIETTKLVYLNYAVEIFFSPSSHPTNPVVIGNHELSASFGDAYDENQNLNSGDEYTTVKTILESITFTN